MDFETPEGRGDFSKLKINNKNINLIDESYNSNPLSLKSAILNYDKINYLTLMMVDRHVHFHIIPRYKEYRVVSGLRIEDIFWPGPPDVTRYIDVNKEFIDNLILLLKSEFIKYS